MTNISSLSFSSGNSPALQINGSDGEGSKQVLTMNTVENTTSEREFQNKYVEMNINGINYWNELYI